MVSVKNIKKLSAPVEDLKYLIVTAGQGDIYMTLVTKETWDSWPDGEPPYTFTCDVPQDQQLYFVDPKEFVNFCVKHGLKIQNAAFGDVF